MNVQEVIKKQAEVRSGTKPGEPGFLNSDNHPVGYYRWQGDLKIKIVDKVPEDYDLVENPTEEDRQLVPLDGSPGSHHRLRSFDGVKLYRPKDWGKSEIDLRGPVVVFDKPNAIVHESGTTNPHGTVHIETPMTIQCGYQRNLDLQEAFERRALD